MDNPIANILGTVALPQEMQTALQEAFDSKIAAVREETEIAIREEMSRRYEHDKNNLVEAMDRMLTDAVTKHATETAEGVAQFAEARTAFRKAVKESRTKYNQKLTENISVSRKYVAERLAKEIKALREEKKILAKEKLRTVGMVESIKKQLVTEQNQHVTKIDSFIVRQLGKEIRELHEDHTALINTRVKLVTEGRKKLRETQAKFVKEAAKKVEKVITESLTKEMTEIHEDLERNRKNMFGRRIFEAFAAEYLTSYLAEGTEVRKLQNNLELTEKNLFDAKSKLDVAIKEGQQASRKAKLAEDRAVRSKVMGELLTPLRGEKRVVMEGMLETIKTDNLRATFKKLLPVVLNENTRNAAPAKKLTENRSPNRSTTVITGDQRNNRLNETRNQETTEFDGEIAQVVRLAGLTK